MSRRRLLDALVVPALIAALEAQLLLRDDPAPTALGVIAGVALVLPLAWRRRAPLAAVAAYVTVAIVQSALGAGLYEGEPPLLASIVTGAVAFHALGVHAAEQAPAGLALGIAGLWTAIVVSPDVDVQSFVFSAGIVALSPWLAGRAARARRLRSEALVREHQERARAAASEERQRIARELHDVVAHGVVLMRLQAQGAERVVAGDPDRAREALRAIDATGAAALGELRRSLGLLRDGGAAAERAPQPTLDDLGALVAEMRGAGLDVELVVDGAKPALAGDVERSAYRVVQEALTNTIRHAGLVRTRVHVRYAADGVELEVSDDGPRRDGRGAAATGDGGHGLAGMRERVRVHGGELEAGARDGRGFVVSARLPVRE